MTDNFLPKDDDKAPKGGGAGRYLKLAKGDKPVKFRILSMPPLNGLLKWGSSGAGGKDLPVRIRLGEDFPTGVVWQQDTRPGKSGEAAPRYFWLLPVWSYTDKQVQVWESTQSTIHEQYKAWVANEDYGDPLGYDFTLTRTDDNKGTSYLLQASPPKPLAAAVASAWETCQKGGFDMTRLYDGGDPFSGPAVAAVAGGEGGDEDVPF